MKSIEMGEFVFTAAVLVVFFICLKMALNYDEKARFVPLVVLVCAVIIGAVELVSTALSRHQVQKGDEINTKKETKAQILSKETAMEIWIVALLGLVLVFGLPLGCLVFTFTFLRFHYREGWLVTVLVSLLCFVIPYGIFIKIMKISLYKGLLLGF